MAEEKCPYHIDHATRISNLETSMKEVIAAMKNPTVTAAFIHLFGVVFAGFMSFAAVVLGPVILAWWTGAGV